MKENRNKTLGLVITDGVGFRNFVLGNFLEEATKVFDKIIIYSGLPADVYEVDGLKGVKVRELPVFEEPFISWFWRKIKEVAHLRLHKDFYGINDNYNANRSTSGSIRGIFTRLIYGITNIFYTEKNIQFFEKKQLNSIASHYVTKTCIEYLEKDRPDILFFSHQRPPYVVPLVSAAEKLQIETCAFIFSWDNLASKGRMAAPFHSYLVWSSLMKQELNFFYPMAKAEKILVVGTPQFEPYVIPEYEISREDFINNFNLDLARKTICYSCGDKSTSRNDEIYIQTIASLIEEEKLVEPVNFLVRTSPAEEPDRFKGLEVDFPFISWNFPSWKNVREDHPEAWSQRVPTRQDLRDLRSILEFSDLGINMCSTMSLDFIIFDKPVINPVFGNNENGLYNDQRFLNFGHYERVVEIGAVRLAKNKAELLNAINYYINNPGEDSAQRKKLLDLQIGKPIKNTSRRIAVALNEIN